MRTPVAADIGGFSRGIAMSCFVRRTDGPRGVGGRVHVPPFRRDRSAVFSSRTGLGPIRRPTSSLVTTRARSSRMPSETSSRRAARSIPPAFTRTCSRRCPCEGGAHSHSMPRTPAAYGFGVDGCRARSTGRSASLGPPGRPPLRPTRCRGRPHRRLGPALRRRQGRRRARRPTRPRQGTRHVCHTSRPTPQEPSVL